MEFNNEAENWFDRVKVNNDAFGDAKAGFNYSIYSSSKLSISSQLLINIPSFFKSVSVKVFNVHPGIDGSANPFTRSR